MPWLFSNAFRLPQGQVPFLKILVEDTLADEEEQTVYNDRKREAAARQAPVSSSDGEDTALVQYYAKLNDGAAPTAAGWLASMLSRWASKSDYLPGAGKDFVQRLVGALAEKRIPHAISLRPVKAIIKAVAFHPYLKRLAVARDDDTVCVYDLQRTMWLPLRLSHEFQKDIKCLEWQPMSGSRLAVGGSRGVCIWRLNGTYLLAFEYKYFLPNIFHFFVSFSYCPDYAISGAVDDAQGRCKAWMRLYATDEHHDILSISWCPRGDFLASASPSSENVMVWDVSLGSGTPLLCAHGHGVNIVRWSHNSFYLFAGAFTNKVFIWETRSWRCESWSLSKGMCQCATWSPDGELIVFAETGTSSLWTLALHHIPPRIDGSLMKIKLDVSLFLETGCEDKEYAAEQVAGSEGIKSEPNSYLCVRELAWSFDRRGQRLALTVSPRIRAQDGVIDDAPATLPGDELIIIYNVFSDQSYVLARAVPSLLG